MPRNAGSSPNAKAVPIDVANVRLTTRQSGLTSMLLTGTPCVSSISSAVLPQYASARPRTPPIPANSRLSVRSCRISRPRPAPMDRRIAISRPRLVARARSRLAMFAHAMASSRPTISSRTMSGVVNSDRIGEKPRDAGIKVTGVARESWLRSGGFSRCSASVMAAAAAGAAPAGTRSMTCSHANSGWDGHGFWRSPPVRSKLPANRSAACIAAGAQMSGVCWSTVAPKKSGAATPTMARGAPLMISSVSKTRGVRPKRRLQYRSLITATGCWPTVRLSSGPSRRPI